MYLHASSFNLYHAGSWKPVATVAATSPHVGSSSDKLQAQTLVPSNDEEQRESASPSNEQDISRSRSASREPGTSPERSDGLEGSDEEANSSSPVKTLPRLLCATVQKSKSRSPTPCRKLSGSTSSPRRSTSKSTTRKKQSRFVVCMCPLNVSVLWVLKELQIKLIYGLERYLKNLIKQT